jgi:general secretion pathway protein J
MTRAASDEGFTLIELMISLALFALIAVAGLALVDSVLGVQSRTEGRLDRLADLQRAMLVVTADIEQVAVGNVSGGADRLSFTRAAPGFGGPPVAVSYALAGGTLTRTIGGAPQRLIDGVGRLRWRFYDGSWQAAWPSGPDATRWPRAVELEMTVAGEGSQRGLLRRVVLLPARAKEPPVS